jgi:hypothetical protein
MYNPRRIFLIEELRGGRWRPVLKEKWFTDARLARKWRKEHYAGHAYATRVADYLGMQAHA